MQSWHRWREPLAVLLLVALGLMLALRAAAVVFAWGAWNTGGFLGGVPGGDDLLLVTTAAAVLWCATPLAEGDRPASPSPHARAVARAGLVVVGVTVLGWLALSIVDVVSLATWPTPDGGFVLFVIEGLLRLAVPAVALVAVVLAVRRTAAARSDAAGRVAVPGATVPAGGDVPAVPAVPAAPERLPASWLADEATGTVWLTADDAAEGRPGLSWSDPAQLERSSPDQQQPDPRPPDQRPPDQRPPDQRQPDEPTPVPAEEPRRSAAADDDLR